MSIKDSQGPLWEVFSQTKPGMPFKHAGSVHAYDKNLAIEAARDLFTRRNEGTGLWVVRSEDIIAVQPEDADSFFEPANDKIYRHPTFYEVPDGVKHM
jgi:ring-1,2-phenylacetyl-CoA epoxidase subunit PaaB